MIVIGASLGGLNALGTILGGLGRDFPLPVAIAQHRGRGPGKNLANLLQKYCSLPVVEVEDKDVIVPGRVYLAPTDYHLLVEANNFALSIDEPVNNARPSVDVLFESAADVYAKRLIGLILTGNLRDGALGLAKIKKQGGFAIVQDPETAEAGDMPRAAITTTDVDRVLPVEEMAPFLLSLCSRKSRR